MTYEIPKSTDHSGSFDSGRPGPGHHVGSFEPDPTLPRLGRDCEWTGDTARVPLECEPFHDYDPDDHRRGRR